METNRILQTIRKFIPTLIIVIIVILLLWAGYIFLARPKVVVTAPIGTTITLTSLTNGQLTVQAKATTNTTTLQVDSGNYTATITQGNAKQLYTIALNLFETKSLTFSAGAQLGSDIMAYQAAYDVMRSGNTLYYLNPTNQTVESLDENGNQATVAGMTGQQTVDSNALPQTVGAIGVIASNQAIVQVNTSLYLLRGGQLTQLKTNGFPSPVLSVVLGTNPMQSSFVIAINQTLYWYASPDAAPQMIMKLDKQFDQLAYGGNRAIAFSTAMPESVENIRSSYSGYAIDPVLIDLSKKTQGTLTTGPIAIASVAADGNHAIVQTQALASVTTLYNLATNQAMYSVENPNVATPLWIDGTHYVYTEGSDIWKYDIDSRSAVTLSSLPGGLIPTSITYDSDNKAYYCTTYNSSDTASIYRLVTTATDENSANAASLVPSTQTNQSFSFKFFNLARPTLLMQNSVSDNNPSQSEYASEIQQSRQAALVFIAGHGVDISKLNILYNPPDPLP